ncbi:hypothetical protein MTR67_047429 [Solanum verrucosum]|uniref:Uncharacterized protein n=1 Tax=Solanum verrucosum TaxID=315347 RepID=A0AAF0UZ17_SOLVR|nr:hypothetical protein MTR67_047429 [Solanum verrucosum]
MMLDHHNLHLLSLVKELRNPFLFFPPCLRHNDSYYWLKLWLFIAYVVSFVSLAASVGLLIQDALGKSGPSAWTGVAGVLQCVFVLIRISESTVWSIGHHIQNLERTLDGVLLGSILSRKSYSYLYKCVLVVQ